MTNEQHGAGSPPAGAISLIERATHFPTVLLMLSLVLALDSGSSFGYRSTLLSLTWSWGQEHISAGIALLFILAFGMFMSIGALAFKKLADLFALFALLPLWRRVSPCDEGKPPYCGAVRPHTLLEAAHIDQNKFYLDLYNEHVLLQDKRREQEHRLASSAFACLLLSALNYLVLPQMGYSTISHQFTADFPVLCNLLITSFSILLLIIWLYPLLRDDRATDWVYCLSLYRKLEREKRKELTCVPIPRSAAE